MKFLLALSVLATTSVFAQYNNGGYKIKCYESAQQNGYGTPAFVFEVDDRNSFNWDIELDYPEHIDLEREHGCLESRHGGGYPGPGPGTSNTSNEKFKACLTQGQEIGGMVPVEIDYDGEEDTYYCGRGILRFLGDDDLI